MALKLKKTDTSKSGEARWEKFDEDTQVLLMPLDNQQYQIALERMRRRLDRNDAQFGEGSVGVIAGEKSEHDNHCMLLAQFILQDWQRPRRGWKPAEVQRGHRHRNAARRYRFLRVCHQASSNHRGRQQKGAGRDQGKAVDRFKWERDWGSSSVKKSLIYQKLRIAVPDEPELDVITGSC